MPTPDSTIDDLVRAMLRELHDPAPIGQPEELALLLLQQLERCAVAELAPHLHALREGLDARRRSTGGDETCDALTSLLFRVDASSNDPMDDFRRSTPREPDLGHRYAPYVEALLDAWAANAELTRQEYRAKVRHSVAEEIAAATRFAEAMPFVEADDTYARALLTARAVVDDPRREVDVATLRTLGHDVLEGTRVSVRVFSALRSPDTARWLEGLLLRATQPLERSAFLHGADEDPNDLARRVGAAHAVADAELMPFSVCRHRRVVAVVHDPIVEIAQSELDDPSLEIDDEVGVFDATESLALVAAAFRALWRDVDIVHLDTSWEAVASAHRSALER